MNSEACGHAGAADRALDTAQTRCPHAHMPYYYFLRHHRQNGVINQGRTSLSAYEKDLYKCHGHDGSERYYTHAPIMRLNA